MGFSSTRSKRSRFNRILEDLATISLSIVVALIVWLVAINQENPLVTEEFPDRIPIAVRGLAETLEPLQDLNDEATRLVVQAPKNTWQNLTARDFNAYIDLTGLGPGIHDVDVEVDVVDPRAQVISQSRPQLRVQIDPVHSREVPVRVEIMDSTAFGYDWQTPVVEPISVTVRGPATLVDQAVSARAEIYLRGAKSQVERSQAVTPVNAQSQPVLRVTAEPAAVRIVVPVEQWPGRKEVAVRVNLEGQPGPGYRLSTVRVNPSTVVLLGSTDALAQVPGFVETEPFPLADATSELSRRLALKLPEGVTVLEGNTVNVTASIATIEGGTTVRQRPVMQNLGAGLDATVALDTVDVILSGPLPLLESLGSDDIFVILDLIGLLPGNHVVTPRVVMPPGLRVEGFLPETVEVVITAPAGTPAPTVLPESSTPVPASATEVPAP